MRRPAVYGKQRGGFSAVAAMHPVSPPAQSICLQGGISYVISLPFAVSRHPPLAAVLNAVHRHRPVRLYPCDGVCAYLGVRVGGAGADILPTGCRTDSGGGLPVGPSYRRRLYQCRGGDGRAAGHHPHRAAQRSVPDGNFQNHSITPIKRAPLFLKTMGLVYYLYISSVCKLTVI